MSGIVINPRNIIGTAQVVTSLNSLASAATWKSNAISGLDSSDTTNTNLYNSIVIAATIITATGTLGTTPVVNIYYAPSIPDGNLPETTGYTDGVTSGNGTWTPPATPLSILIASITIDTVNVAKSGRWIINNPAPSGVIWIQNTSGLALASSGNSVWVKPKLQNVRVG